MGKIRKIYSIEIKKPAVKEYLKGNSSCGIARKLNLSCDKIVGRWAKHYKNEGWKDLKEKRGKTRGIGKGRPRKQPLSLALQLYLLRASGI